MFMIIINIIIITVSTDVVIIIIINNDNITQPLQYSQAAVGEIYPSSDH